MSPQVGVSAFAVWTPGGVWVNAAPLAGPPEAGLAPWPAPSSMAAIHPKGRRPHRQAAALVQLAHALLSARAGAGGNAPPPQELANTDILLGTAVGSAEADMDFLQGLQERGSGFGSPSTFVYTLATAAPAEVALALGLGGSLATLSAGNISGLCAVVRAAQHVGQGRSRACITGGIELGGVRDHTIFRHLESEIAALFLLEPLGDWTVWPKLSEPKMGFDVEGSARVGGPYPSAISTLVALASACAEPQRAAPIEIAGASREGHWARILSGGTSPQLL